MAKRPKLLVVEGAAGAGGRLAASLETAGYPAAACRGAAQAAALAGREEFDLALIGALQPGPDGATLCRGLLTLPVPLRAILFADSCVQSDLDRAFASGAVGFQHGPDAARRVVGDVRSYHADAWPCVIPRSGRLGRGREVLIVDDDPEIAGSAAWEVAAEGFGVTLAADGRQGLLAAARRCPQAVLLDVNLPDRRLSEMLPALKAGPRPPIVLLWTGAEGAADERRFLELGADDFTVKCVHPLDSLPLRLARILERPRAPAGPLVYGALRLCLAERQVWVGERLEATLTPKEFAIVQAAAARGQNGVRWRELCAVVDGMPEERCLDVASVGVRVHLRHAREKLDRSSVRLETLDGFGLRLEVAA